VHVRALKVGKLEDGMHPNTVGVSRASLVRVGNLPNT